MYRTIVARRTRHVFDALNRADADPLLAGFGPHPRHVMDGEHCLAGERHRRESIEQWYGRLFHLLPDLRFDVDAVLVAGPPWRTVVAVQWRDHALGGRYRNRGVNVIRLRWGKVESVDIYCDTELMARTLHDLARRGTAEAAAAPITDAPVRGR
jgi:ketosteroid isomerase-like protein